MKDLKGIRGKYYIASLIEEGEHERQDFKFAVSDARKIARSLSAFANHSGGRLLIGVKDNGAIAGVRNDEDVYVVEQAALMYCLPPVELHITPFRAEGGLTVVRVEVDPAATPPVMVREGAGSMRAYYRVADQNIAVPDLMLRAWQRRGSSGGKVCALTPEGTLLLQLASRPGGIDPDAFMLEAHMSRRGAEELMLDLHGMGLLAFTYTGSHFTLTAATPS